MNEAVGIWPAYAEEIDEASLVRVDANLDGVSYAKRNGVEVTLVGQLGLKRVKTLTSFDQPPFDVTVPEWYLPFGSNDKLADPAALPPLYGSDLAWTDDGRYLAFATTSATPYMNWYERNGDVLTKLTWSPSQPASASGCSWTPDGQYLAAAFPGSPGLTTYKRTGNTLAAMAPLSGGTNNSDCAWSPDGMYLLVTGINGTSLWKRAIDVVSALASPTPQPPAGSASAVAWAPNGIHAAVSCQTAPYLWLYKRAGDVLAKLPDVVAPPTGIVQRVNWSPDGQYLAVSQLTAPYLTIYKQEGDVFTKLPDVALPPTGGYTMGIAWSPDGLYLAVAGQGTPYVQIYRRTGDVFTKLPDVSPLPSTLCRNVAFSPDGRILAVLVEASPYILTYKAAGEVYGGYPVAL